MALSKMYMYATFIAGNIELVTEAKATMSHN